MGVVEGAIRRARARGSNAEENAITRACMERSLVLLMRDQPFERISITDICRKAGVSRTAYYRNYASKEEILASRIRAIASMLSDAMRGYDAVTQTRESWEALLGAVSGMAEEYRLLLDAGFCGMMAQEFAAAMNEGVAEDDTVARYANVYWAGAISSVVAEWVRSDMAVPAAQVAQVGAALMTHGVRLSSLIGRPCGSSS